MYVEFQAHTKQDGSWEMHPDLEKKIYETIPSGIVDEFITASPMSGEDENGEYMCYCYGTDSFFEDDGITELEGTDLEAEENAIETNVISIYIALFPLVGKEIIDLWINDGSQFGWRPSIESAQEKLQSIDQ